MTWVLVIWCVLILVWVVGGANSAQENCDATTQLEQDACDVGTGIGVAAVMLIGFVGFIFFSLIWLMTRPTGRDCPTCGELVKKGQTVCANCGHDFAAAGGPPTAAGDSTTVPVPAAPQAVPPGWFPDPVHQARLRYWDGTQWTDHVDGEAT